MSGGGSPVLVGVRYVKLAGVPVPAEHWAVKVAGTWYEVKGDTAKSTGTPNVIVRHTDDCKYSRIETRAPTATAVSDDEVQI